MLIYNAGVILYTLAIHFYSIFNSKAGLWVKGRYDWRKKLKKACEPFRQHDKIWIHCASLGEFEQGRPVIEKIKELFPETKIILTFFSPSGYEIRKNYEFADIVFYLPYDSKRNARDFISICHPKTVIFVKYEFWLNYLFELAKKKIPVYLISAVIKKHQPFFRWYGSNFIKALYTYKKIIVQDEDSLKLLQSLHVENGIVCGDTRIDRVLKIGNSSEEIPEIKMFAENFFVLIAGSTWLKDETLLVPVFSELIQQYPKLKLIIAPHEINDKHISEIETLLNNNNLRYRLFTNKNSSSDFSVLVLNTMGMLAAAYRYGKIAFVGGGFDNGIHNILEPAAHGLPVIFGPNHIKFNEATALIKCNAAFEIQGAEELKEITDKLIRNQELFKKTSSYSATYVNINKGATDKIIELIFGEFK